jgi:hypothetical protein
VAGAQRLDARAALTLATGGTGWVLIVLLAAAGVLELVLLRLVYRVGLFVPRDGPLFDGYRAATFVGSLAFDAASILAIAIVAVLAFRLGARRTASWSLAATAALAVAAALLPDVRDAVRAGLAGSAIVAATALVAPALRERDRPILDRAGIALVTLVVLVAQATALEAALAAVLPVPPVIRATWLAEGPAIAAAMLLGASALRARPGVGALAVAAAGGGGLAVALALSPYLAGIVLLWSTGVTLAFPTPSYPIAFAAILLAAATAARRCPERAVGLALLIVAGVIPQSTTHVLVALLALALLAAAGGAMPDGGS